MNLQELKPTNFKRTRTMSASVNLNVKAGLFALGKSATEQMKFVDGDMVKLYQDKDDPKQWYVQRVPQNKIQPNSIQVRIHAGRVEFNSVDVIRTIFESIGYKYRAITLLLAGQPTIFKGQEMYGILVPSNIND